MSVDASYGQHVDTHPRRYEEVLRTIERKEQPLTAHEIATETNRSLEQVCGVLSELRDQGRIRQFQRLNRLRYTDGAVETGR